MDWLVVGLGNPGPEYTHTRHNMGFLVLDQFDVSFVEKEIWKASIAQLTIGHQKILLAKPHTMMNNSGESVSLIQSFYKIPTDHIIVIYDDIDLPFGQMRVKVNKSPGGHNGIKSILSFIDSAFLRVRVGIQDLTHPQKAKGYVLQPFSETQKKELPAITQKAKNAVVHIIERGLLETMNTFN